jgi:hypothetical protein
MVQAVLLVDYPTYPLVCLYLYLIKQAVPFLNYIFIISKIYFVFSGRCGTIKCVQLYASLPARTISTIQYLISRL